MLNQVCFERTELMNGVQVSTHGTAFQYLKTFKAFHYTETSAVYNLDVPSDSILVISLIFIAYDLSHCGAEREGQSFSNNIRLCVKVTYGPAFSKLQGLNM